ncbi:MAG: histidine phosphatase family protein, partial [Chitinophagales bacterium]
MIKEIYLIRHGETDFNRKGIVQGKGVDSVLNENGIAQSQLFFEAYKQVGFDKIYVSNLKRTFQTVAPFAKLQIPVIPHAGLDEISWGVHEGQKDGDSFRRFYEIL